MMKFEDFVGALNAKGSLLSPSAVATIAKNGVLPLENVATVARQDSDGAYKGIAAASKFVLGSTSLAHLNGVVLPLVNVVKLAIERTTQDFTVYEGLRSIEQQRKNMARGVSKTMDSMHLKQSDGYGHAVDLVPWIQGHPVWDWDGCWKIAAAMTIAATELHCADKIRWGGAWDKRLSDFAGNFDALKAATHDYSVRHAGPDFLDGPHFEWRS